MNGKARSDRELNDSGKAISRTYRTHAAACAANTPFSVEHGTAQFASGLSSSFHPGYDCSGRRCAYRRGWIVLGCRLGLLHHCLHGRLGHNRLEHSQVVLELFALGVVWSVGADVDFIDPLADRVGFLELALTEIHLADKFECSV